MSSDRLKSRILHFLTLTLGLLIHGTLGASLPINDSLALDNVTINENVNQEGWQISIPGIKRPVPQPNSHSPFKFSPRKLFARDVVCDGVLFATNTHCCAAGTRSACYIQDTCCDISTPSACCSPGNHCCPGAHCCPNDTICCGLGPNCCGQGVSCVNGVCMLPTVTTTIFSTTYASRVSTVAVTTTSFVTTISTLTSTSIVSTTLNNVATATAIDKTVVITKRDIYVTALSTPETTIPIQLAISKTDIEQREPLKAPLVKRVAPEVGTLTSIGNEETVTAPLIKRAVTSTLISIINGGTITSTTTIYAGTVVTTTSFSTVYTTITSTIVVGAQTTIHITLTSTTTSGVSTSSTVASTSSTPHVNPFLTTGPVAAALSTLRSLVPVSAQTDPTVACFALPTYSSCYKTPAWWSSLPVDSQSFFISTNSANNAACTSCSSGGRLSTGAKAGIGIGTVAGVAIIAGLIAFARKAGIFNNLLGRGAPESVGGAGISSSAAHAAGPTSASSSAPSSQSEQPEQRYQQYQQYQQRQTSWENGSTPTVQEMGELLGGVRFSTSGPPG